MMDARRRLEGHTSTTSKSKQEREQRKFKLRPKDLAPLPILSRWSMNNRRAHRFGLIGGRSASLFFGGTKRKEWFGWGAKAWERQVEI